MPQPLPMFSFTMPELQARMRDFVYRPRPLAETEERNEEYALLIQFSNWLSSRPAEGLEEAIFGVAPWQKDHALRWDKLHRLGWFGEHPQNSRKSVEVGIRMVHAKTGQWAEFITTSGGMSLEAIHTTLLEAAERFIAKQPTPPRG